MLFYTAKWKLPMNIESDYDFMRYVEMHSKTERALFRHEDVIRFALLTGMINQEEAKLNAETVMKGSFSPIHYSVNYKAIDRWFANYHLQESNRIAEEHNSLPESKRNVIKVDFIQKKVLRRV